MGLLRGKKAHQYRKRRDKDTKRAEEQERAIERRNEMKRELRSIGIVKRP